MATRKIGKLKFNLSREGLAFKWGDSQVRRIYFPQFGRAEEEDYDDRNPSGAYDDAPDDARYDDRYADDGYGTGGDYDRYEDEDGYDDYDEPSRFMQFIEDSDWLNILLLVLLPPVGIYLLWWRNRYHQPLRIGISAASAIWFIVALALIIPAFFRGSSDKTTPPVMTLATASPTPAITATPTPAATATPAITATPIATQVPDLISNFMEGLDGTSPSATPLTSSFGSSTAPDEYVYSPTSGMYYHATQNCTGIPAGTTTTRMALSAAQNRNQSPCPVCYGGTLYYCTENGTHYHSDKTCSDMVNPSTYTKESAESMGKTACPVCVLHTQTSLDNDKTSTASYSGILKNVSADKSGIKVWCTKNGTNYHTSKNCRGMAGASQVTLLKAIQAGKTPCSTCCSGAGTLVWCTKNGKSYHATKNCSGMTGASQVTYAEALVLGKTRCTTCLKDSSGTSSDTGSSSGTNVSSGNSNTDGVTVYATRNGSYYHTKRTCGGMANAQKVSLEYMIEIGRPACPTCCASADDTVYCSTGGTYYHSYATCTGMNSAKKTTLAHALAGGYKKCDKCWGTSSENDDEDADDKNESASSGSSSSGVHVYATEDGKYYHTNSTCGGMRNAERVSLSSMLAEGRPACPTCCATASRTVYAKKSSKYYHYDKSCCGSGAVSGTLAEALAYGLKACPDCTKSSSSSNDDEKENTSSGNSGYTYTSGKSGVKVYATANGKNFHTKSTCSGMTGASYMTLEAALNAGKTPCSTCASSAKKTVYATTSSKYYHYTKTCAGSGAKSGTLAEAMAYGLKACPSCTKSSSSNDEKETETPNVQPSNTYKSGTSGKKVYATVNGKHYHAKSDCTGMKGASYITLETALNYGKTACPTCLSSAGRTVYAVKGNRYYHASKICAGSGAKGGTLGEALAYGLKACPTCVTGSGSSSGGSSSSGSNDSYFDDDSSSGGSSSGSSGSSGSTTPPASADTTVYIDLDSIKSLYHSKKTCGGMSGTSVTLEYAVDQGMKPCSSCNPPSGISD